LAFGDQKLHKEALADWTKVIELEPKYSTGYYNRGLTFAALGKNKEAIIGYTMAIKLGQDENKIRNQRSDDGMVRYYTTRGEAYSEVGKKREAIVDFTTAIKLDPKDPDHAYLSRGQVYESAGKIKEAVADFTAAIKLHPEHHSAYEARGGIYQGLGRIRDAEADFAKAKELEK
jgi:tetratricopeptide (TPR) repeat protein